MGKSISASKLAQKFKKKKKKIPGLLSCEDLR